NFANRSGHRWSEEAVWRAGPGANCELLRLMIRRRSLRFVSTGRKWPMRSISFWRPSYIASSSSADPRVKCVVPAANGASFSAGHDIVQMADERLTGTEPLTIAGKYWCRIGELLPPWSVDLNGVGRYIRRSRECWTGGDFCSGLAFGTNFHYHRGVPL